MELIGERLKGILVCIGGRSGIRQSKAVGRLVHDGRLPTLR